LSARSIVAIMRAMKAIQLTHFGAPEQLQLLDVERPKPGPRQYLIEVHASSVNPVDWKLRSGSLRPFLWPRLPVVLGFDVCGVVVERGAAATRFATGSAVYARLDSRFGGGYAQYAVASESAIAHKPNNLSDAEAATVPLAGLTALQALRDCGHLQAGQRVLIVGGMGGVGHFAVQIARAHGAHVAASCSTANVARVRELGAEHVIDYRSEPYRTFDLPYDVILDTVIAERFKVFAPLLAPHGRYVAATPSLELLLRAPLVALTSRRRIAFVMLKTSGADLEELTNLIEAGKLRPIVDRSYPLAETAAAHAYAEQGHVHGKVAVIVDA
jgi:2-desacetyl-2-hydroxyethyl bacteriochlorophyllide A dehydrogenase